MSKREQAEFDEWQERQKGFQTDEGFPALPDVEVDDETWEEHRALQNLYTQLPSGATAVPPALVETALGRPVPSIKMRDDILKFGKKLVANVEKQAGLDQPIVGPPIAMREYKDERGRLTRDHIAADNTVVEREQFSSEETEAAENRVKGRIDAVYDANGKLEQARRIREILGGVTDPTAADTLRQQADDRYREGREELDRLKAEMVTELRERGLTENEISHSLREDFRMHYEPMLEGVDDALTMLKTGDVDGLADHMHDNMSPAARMQLRRKADEDPEVRSAWQQVLQVTNDESVEKAKASISGGIGIGEVVG